MDILSEIVDAKREELRRRKEECPLAELREKAQQVESRPSLAHSLRQASIGLIAEVKRCSPSAGIIRKPMYPARVAADYEAAGAQALSVLMDEKYFGGGEGDFREVRSAVSLPMLYKEFVIDPWQVWHAAGLGASAILLIVAALDRAELDSLLDISSKAGIEALVEVHNAEEMRIAGDAGAVCIGINNRNLKTFEVALETTLKLKDLAPLESTLVSESGIRSSKDVVRLREAGLHGILVGEQLLRQEDVGQAVRDLMEKVWVSS